MLCWTARSGKYRDPLGSRRNIWCQLRLHCFGRTDGQSGLEVSTRRCYAIWFDILSNVLFLFFHRNKKGLAIALAQIVASRAQQRNFQLIMITHDEEFVSMMKTELTSLTGFSMPEKYFQVRREMSSDGKYYSKIDAIDWDELE